jgi:aspartate racemase
MGPASGLYFARKLIELNTSASADNEHPKTIIYSNTQIPSRVDAYHAIGTTPVDSIVDSVNRIAGMDADFCVIICNTAHIFFDEITARTKLPLISLVENLARELKDNPPATNSVALLATEATVKSGLYENHLHSFGLTVVTPNEHEQALINKAIFDTSFGIKATRCDISDESVNIILSVSNQLHTRTGANHVILGCTELSLAFDLLSKAASTLNKITFIDPLETLARRCLVKAGYLSEKPAFEYQRAVNK